jgi:hypothetical protein
MRRVHAVGDQIDGEVLSPQRACDGRAKVMIIFDKQDPHPPFLDEGLKPKLNEQVQSGWCSVALGSLPSSQDERK